MTALESYREADCGIDLVDIATGELLADAAAEAPSAVAVVEVDSTGRRREMTYAELLDAAVRTAVLLRKHYEPGDRVAIWSPSSLNWEVFQFGAALAGLIVVTVNPSYRATELGFVLRQSRCSGIALTRQYRGVDQRELLDKVRETLPALRHVHDLDSWDPPGVDDAEPLAPVDSGAAAMIQYTSGTTGMPKGVLLSHRGLVNNARLIARRLGLDNGSTWLDPLPMFHLGGCELGAMGAMWTRSTHVVFTFEPGLALKLVESEAANFIPAVPTMLFAMLEHPHFATTDRSSLQVIMSGATTVPPDVVQRVEADFGCQFAVSFGQTECSGLICQTFPDDTAEDKAHYAGLPLEHTEIRIVDKHGALVPRGTTGEIHVRSFGVMLRYFDAPEQTRETLSEDGWLHTGDLGEMDDRGYIKVTGRLKDMIIRGGENIFPREIEDRLHTHSAVGDAAVVGIPDQRWGEQIAAFVRLVEPGSVTQDDLVDFLRSDLSPGKVPRIWVSVTEMPLTPSGKIQKFVLLEEYLAGNYKPLP